MPDMQIKNPNRPQKSAQTAYSSLVLRQGWEADW